MPYKFQTDRVLMPKGKDRRVKLTDEQREEIRGLYGSISQRKLAKMFGVSRRLIIFIGCPEKKARNLECREERGGTMQYYDKDAHTNSMREHRQYKQSVMKGLDK